MTRISRRLKRTARTKASPTPPPVKYISPATVPTETSSQTNSIKRLPMGYTFEDFPIWDVVHQDEEAPDNEYSEEIHKYLLGLEVERLASEHHIGCLHPWFDASARTMVINFLLLVSCELYISSSTVYQSINILERYMSRAPIEEEDYQLFAFTSLVIATKFQDVLNYRVSEYVKETEYLDSDITASMVVECEKKIMETLEYEISSADPLDFLKWENSGITDEKTLYCSRYLLEIMSWDYNFIETRPSVMAATASHVARSIYLEEESRCGTGTPKKQLQNSIDNLIVALSRPLGLCVPFFKYMRLEPYSVPTRVGRWVLDSMLPKLKPIRSLIYNVCAQ